MEKSDLLHLRVIEEKNGCSIYLDDKKLHHVEDYKIEQSVLLGTAKVKLDVLVKFP